MDNTELNIVRDALEAALVNNADSEQLVHALEIIQAMIDQQDKNQEAYEQAESYDFSGTDVADTEEVGKDDTAS